MEPLQYQSHSLLYREKFEIETGHQPQNALMIMKSGRFSCCFSDQNTFFAEPGDLIFFPVRQKFTRKVLEPCTFHLIYFTLYDQNPFSNCLPTGKIVLHDRARLSCNTTLFDEIPYDTDPYAEAIKHHALNDIFLMFCREYAPKQSTDNHFSPQIHRISQYCAEHISDRITLQDLATVGNMSVSTMTKRFRLETGFTPMEYLIRLRMQNAVRLLTKTVDPISEIAERCGYENIYYFSNAFKKIYGYSPSEQRRKIPHA